MDKDVSSYKGYNVVFLKTKSKTGRPFQAFAKKANSEKVFYLKAYDSMEKLKRNATRLLISKVEKPTPAFVEFMMN